MRRETHGEATRSRLKYAQVYEDPLLEIEALRPSAEKHLMVVSSGGCTALSLLTAGAGRVTAVDYNPIQNDLVELKAAAVACLGEEASPFLGGSDADPASREALYRDELRAEISDDARQHWDAHLSSIRRGLIGAGSAERFGAFTRRALTLLIHPKDRVERMLAAPSLEAQRALYEQEWDTARWRAMFRILFGRLLFRGRFWGPEVGAAARSGEFAEHFRLRFERSLTEQSIGENYFLHYLLAGRYPEAPDRGPLFLAGGDLRREDLTLADGTVTAWLRAQPADSVHGFALSNIIEWLPSAAIDPLWEEVIRTAAPGARVCFRNLLGWTDVPEAWRHAIRERSESARMFDGDRSTIQRRFVSCDVL